MLYLAIMFIIGGLIYWSVSRSNRKDCENHFKELKKKRISPENQEAINQIDGISRYYDEMYENMKKAKTPEEWAAAYKPLNAEARSSADINKEVELLKLDNLCSNQEMLKHNILIKK